MNPGDHVRVDRADRTYEGVLLPSSTDDHLVVKLEADTTLASTAPTQPSKSSSQTFTKSMARTR